MSSVLRSVRKRKKNRKLGKVEIVRREEYGEFELDGKVEAIRALVPLGLMHVVKLVGAADAGQTHNELQALLHVRVHNALLGLVRDQLIGRERIEKLYLYVSAAAKRAAAQLKRRRELVAGTAEVVTEVPVVLVIAVLLELVREGPVMIAPSVVAKRLGARGISATVDQVKQVFAGHGLTTSKKTPR